MTDATGDEYTPQGPWPKDGDLPFSNDGDPWAQTGVYMGPDDGFSYRMRKGYKQAADALATLVEERESDRHPDPFFVMFPIVSNYRRFLELELAHLRTEAVRVGRLDSTDVSGDDLSSLWADFRRAFEKDAGPEDLALVKVVDASISQWLSIDRSGLAFQLPRDVDEVNSLPEDFRSFNLGNLRRVMAGIAAFLGGVESQMQAELDLLQEMAEAYS